MRTIVPATFACALVIGACNGDDSTATSYGGYAGSLGGCQAYTSCTTCTPVPGCGWCFDSDGRGMCGASPDECATPAFSWTWNPSGCRVAADASTAPLVEADAGSAPSVEEDATASGESSTSPSVAVDAGRPPADGAASTDAVSAPLEASVADGAPE